MRSRSRFRLFLFIIGFLLLALIIVPTIFAQESVYLSWQAPAAGASSDPNAIVSYNIYRSNSGGSFAKIGNTSVPGLTYVDSSVSITTAAVSYSYYATSVDSVGNESTPSNTTTVTVPGINPAFNFGGILIAGLVPGSMQILGLAAPNECLKFNALSTIQNVEVN